MVSLPELKYCVIQYLYSCYLSWLEVCHVTAIQTQTLTCFSRTTTLLLLSSISRPCILTLASRELSSCATLSTLVVVPRSSSRREKHRRSSCSLLCVTFITSCRNSWSLTQKHPVNIMYNSEEGNLITIQIKRGIDVWISKEMTSVCSWEGKQPKINVSWISNISVCTFTWLSLYSPLSTVTPPVQLFLLCRCHSFLDTFAMWHHLLYLIPVLLLLSDGPSFVVIDLPVICH